MGSECEPPCVAVHLPSSQSLQVALLFAAGLPPSGSWQDLKDHMREAGDVCYADVFRDGTGVVEYVRKEDMSFAIRKLDNTKFRSHEVSRHLCAGLFVGLELKRNKKSDNN